MRQGDKNRYYNYGHKNAIPQTSLFRNIKYKDGQIQSILYYIQSPDEKDTYEIYKVQAMGQ